MKHLLALLAGIGGCVAAERPNVILIMADDVGYECFGAYGSTQYRTPNIDRMAGQGMRFLHCHSQPLCTPSRVKIMTGISNVRNYSGFSVLNRDQRTLGSYFKEAGYTTAIAGKWQLLGAEHYPERFRGRGTRPEAAGFDRVCLWQVDRLGSRFWNPLLYVDGENRQFGKDDYGPAIVNDYALKFMEEHRDRPFFLYYPMILVHSPFEPTPDSESRGSRNKQKNFEDMVAYMDRMVGKVVDQARRLGIAEKTLILFTGDNGTHKSIVSRLNGVEIRGGKGSTTDAGTRVPCVAWWPGTVPAGRTSEPLVDFSDFLPTALEAAGITASAELDGQSFLPQLRGGTGRPREFMFCYYNPRPEKTQPVRFVRDTRWKLYGDGRFYDVANDVLERHPLAAGARTADAAAAFDRLTKAIASFPAEGQTLLTFPE
jgi:arylsulfatase A